MKPKQKRLWFVILGLCMVALGFAIILNVFKDNLVFFFTPSELVERQLTEGQALRVGGLVKEGSVSTLPDGSLQFVVTDMSADLTVSYTGLVPNLFREGQGVVADGTLGADGVFTAKSILAKHDENYMPPKVKDALEESGHWMEAPDITEEAPAP